MKFEKDLFALFFRTVLLYVLAILLYMLIDIFFLEIKKADWNVILKSAAIITLIVLFFLTHSVRIIEKKLILKNIYGFTLKSLDLKSPYRRKIKTLNAPRGSFWWTLFSKKYESTTSVHFKAKHKRKSLYISEHILSRKGFQQFIRVTKR